MEAAFTLTSSPLVPLPQQLAIVTTVQCGSIRVKQLSGRPVRFVVTDAANARSPITVPAGGEYAFLNSGNGFGANVSVGSISITDAPDYPEGQLFQFTILQR